jgi:hypothetical protein
MARMANTTKRTTKRTIGVKGKKLARTAGAKRARRTTP